MSDPVSLEPGASILDCVGRPTSMTIPLAAYHRLDRLADLLRTSRASRNEIVAMLVAGAPLDPDELKRQLDRYRASTIGDVLGHVDPSDDAVVVPIRRPGRPPRSGA